jgi:golgi-specific brefeldin A-resistance guanine nucleotide exchange factor 1
MRAPVVLHAISSFNQEILDHSALPILKGLSRCISNPGPLRNEVTTSPDFWSILQRLHKHKEGAEMVFGLLQSVTNSPPSAVTADNYESAVSLANDFATAGSVGSVFEQRRDMAGRRAKGGKQPPKPKYKFPM